MILIGISGKKGVGKDLLANFLVKNFGFLKVPFAETLKEGVRRDFNLTHDHTDGTLKELELPLVRDKYWVTNGDLTGLQTEYWTPRSIMIEYGQFFRQFDPNWWINKTFDKIASYVSLGSTIGSKDYFRFVISDVRFSNEASYIRKQGGIIVRLERKPELNIYKEPSNDISETDLDNYDFDVRLSADKNKYPEDLHIFSKEVMEYVSIVKGYGNYK